MGNLINAVFFQRKQYTSGNYSVEFIFNDVRKRLSDKISASVFVSTYHSQGIFKRLYNMIEVMFNQGEVNFITGDIHYISFFLKKKRTILTILDSGFLYDSSGLSRWLQTLLWLKIPVRRVEYITTISPHSKSDILKHTDCNPDKIKIIPVAIRSIYKHYPKRFRNDKPILLQIGQAKNKNLHRIIDAIKEMNVQLSIIGKIAPENKALLEKFNIDFVNRVNISDKEMLQEYINCDMLVFPSIYEGFGMPIIESQAVGRPVLTSNTTSMPWVAGGASHLVDPLSVASIKLGILKILTDNKYSEELIKKGFENVKRFDPNLIAKQYFEVIKLANKR